MLERFRQFWTNVWAPLGNLFLRMGISPRTFESHRAEAMRKLGARNTADLVRKALLLQDAI